MRYFYLKLESTLLVVLKYLRHRQDSGELLTAVIRISIHPEYLSASEEAKESGGYRADGTFQNDVAVLELAARVRFDRYVLRIYIVTQYFTGLSLVCDAKYYIHSHIMRPACTD